MDFLIYPLVAYLACAVFGASPKGASDHTRGAEGAPPRDSATAALAGFGVVTLVLVLSALPAYSQNCSDTSDMGCRSTGCPESCEVTIGFRADAEPFSFLVKTDDRKQFQGYLADLCYALFNGSPYQITSEPVTVEDRFDRIRGASAGSAVDMLCDPLTLRFSEQAQELRGLYSPIVFTSGVTYLLRKTGAPRRIAYLGYVKGSTAGKVAKKACQVDLFRIREPGEGPLSGECHLPEAGTLQQPNCILDKAIPGSETGKPRERTSPALCFLPDERSHGSHPVVLSEHGRWASVRLPYGLFRRSRDHPRKAGSVCEAAETPVPRGEH